MGQASWIMLVWDDVGDPDGVPVVYLHGTPDCRLARHPDDGIAAAVGVRLLAVDRPGYGGSPFDPAATVGSVARAVIELADALGLDRFGVLAWSGGTPYALATAASAGDRVTRLAIAAGLPPIAGRDDLRELLDTTGLTPAELAEESAPLIAPDPAHLNAAVAAEHLRENSDPVRAVEVASIPGAEQQLAEALVAALQTSGLRGLERDLEVLASEPDVDVLSVEAPTQLLYGEADPLAPAIYGRWLAARLANATLEVVADASHAVILTRWKPLLEWLRL